MPALAALFSRRALWEVCGQLGLFIAAALYFCADLTTRQVTLLESQDLGIATDLLKKFALSPDHSPLHFVFLGVWQGLLPSSAAFLRLPSVCFSALAVTSVYRLARREAGLPAGIVAGLLLASNPLVVDNARSLRLYALGLLLTALCLESAHAHVTDPRRRWALPLFTGSAVLAVHNHLFLWLPVGCLAALVAVVDYRRTSDPRAHRRLLRHALIGAVLLLPQLIHGFVAVGFTSDRHGLYPGLSASGSGFLGSVGRLLFLGDNDAAASLTGVWLFLPLGMLVLGVAVTGRRGAVVAAVLFTPLLLGWLLSRSSQVEARYFNFLVPGIAVFTALGARARSNVATARAAGALGVVLFSVTVTRIAYREPETGFTELARRLEQLARPGDVVAVFPGYWARTFHCYSPRRELVPVTTPGDLDRVLARGERVLLVHNDGRIFDSMAVFLGRQRFARPLFSVSGEEQVEVLEVAARERPSPSPLGASAVVFAGVVGSGGYPWLAGDGREQPFARLAPFFADARAVITGFEPYRPPLLVWPLLGGDAARNLERDEDVLQALARAGVRAVVTTGPSREEALGRDLPSIPFGSPGVEFRAPPGTPSAAPLRVFALSDAELTAARAELLASAASRTLAHATARARSAAGPEALLAVIVPAAPDYGRVATPEERSLAQALVGAGVDLVIGEGGYASKEIEEQDGALIAYSLGTLVRPPQLALAAQASSGVVLRVLPAQRRHFGYDVTPVTFDDRSRPAFDASEDATRLLVHPSEHARSLSELVSTAQTSSSAALSCERGSWDPHLTTRLRPSVRALYDFFLPLSRWFPNAPLDSPLEPVAGGCARGRPAVMWRGVTSLGAYRRVLEVDPGPSGRQAITLPRVELGRRLELGYGLPDDRLMSRFRRPPSEHVSVFLDDKPVFDAAEDYAAGWHDLTLDTTPLAGRFAALRFVVASESAGFPVAFDATLREF